MKRLEQYDTYSLPVASIFDDPDFNCREKFTLESIEALAASIAKSGLEYPVTVRPWDQVPGYGYQLLAGFRRFASVSTILKWTEIPATIRYGLSDFEAHKLNFLENLERKDLNLLEEARGLIRLFPNGCPTIRQVQSELGRSFRWAYIRLRLLQLPDKIQHMVAAGLLTKADIETLDRVKGEKRQLVAAEALAQAHREHGRKRPNMRLPYNKYSLKSRSKAQINEMVAHMLQAGITGLAPRVGAWCAGQLSDEELLADIQKEIEARQ